MICNTDSLFKEGAEEAIDEEKDSTGDLYRIMLMKINHPVT
jgi:hypothetical protein